MLGYDNLWLIAGHLFAVVTAVCYLAMLIHWRWTGPTAARAIWILTIASTAAIVGLAALYVAAGTPARSQPWTDGSPNPVTTVLFRGSASGVYGIAAAAIAAMCLRQALQARRAHRWLFAGLTTMGVGAVLALVQPIIDAAFIAVYWTGPASDHFEVILDIGYGASAVGGALIASGAIIPTVGPLAGRLRTRIRQARHAADLQPLWRCIVEGLPTVVLTTSRDRRRARLSWRSDFLRCLIARDTEWELHRRLIEIRDGYLEVRPWMDFDVESVAHLTAKIAGMRGYDLRAVTEAAILAAALRDREGGLPAKATSTADPGAPSKAEEIAWLTRVADAISSPLVSEILVRLDRRPQHTPDDDPAQATVDLNWAATADADTSQVLRNQGRQYERRRTPGEHTTQNINARRRPPRR